MSEPRAPRERLLALDVFRGATIAAMILVNNPGDWGKVYAPLLHAKWHGWTPTDLVFPFFLWIVGVAIVLGLGGRVASGAPLGAVAHKIVRRALLLVAIGLALNGLGFLFEGLAFFERWRFPGVLQRIGIAYGVAALLFLRCRGGALVAITAGLLIGYAVLLAFCPVPGLGAPDLADPARTIAAWLDRSVFGTNHLWSSAKVYDPEGLLSTLPAIATTLAGVSAGLVVTRAEPLERRIAALMVGGVALATLGFVWDWFLPINKPLWTSSYAVFTAGLASCGFGVALWVCDVRGWRRVVEPFRVYGVNAITVFVGSALLGRVLREIPVGDEPLSRWLYHALCTSWLSGKPASLCWALLWVSAWYLALRWMDRRGMRLRV